MPYLKSKTCTQQTQTYGDSIDVADIPDDEYILVVSADPKALASGMSFRTSIVIFPSNHTNQCHGRFGGGGADGCGWDFENAPMESTGVVNNNCCTIDGFQAGYEYFSSAYLGTCLERATLGTSLNQESSMFAVRFKAAAWHGYNAMVLNVQAQFCYTGTDNGSGLAVPCLQCSSVASLNLDIPYFCNQTGPDTGAPDADNYTGCDDALDWGARRRLEESLPAQDIQVSLKMLNPKYIIDTENTPFEDGMAAFDSAAAFAVILGFLSLLF